MCGLMLRGAHVHQVDKQLESGEYFLNEKRRKMQKLAEKREAAAVTAAARKAEADAELVAPSVRTQGTFILSCCVYFVRMC